MTPSLLPTLPLVSVSLPQSRPLHPFPVPVLDPTLEPVDPQSVSTIHPDPTNLSMGGFSNKVVSLFFLYDPFSSLVGPSTLLSGYHYYPETQDFVGCLLLLFLPVTTRFLHRLGVLCVPSEYHYFTRSTTPGISSLRVPSPTTESPMSCHGT